MTSLQIPIEVAAPSTGMAQAILTELVNHMQQLVDTGASHVIDLASLPMSDTDKQELESLLGKGEVTITLHTLGDSHIFETAFSGIWWIKHYTADQHLISELIEIATVPEIIRSHPEDIRKSSQDLKELSIP